MSGTCLAHATTITIATVNNSQMVVMQKLSSVWEKKTGNTINWVVLEENVLRQRVTTDIATHGGQFDIITIGSYETPIWGKQGWLTPLDGIPGYDYADVFSSVRSALSANGKLYASFLRRELLHLLPEGSLLGRWADHAREPDLAAG
jgi:ABC-type glycerol-3-phosphate transport system substrate-binding protein